MFNLYNTTNGNNEKQKKLAVYSISPYRMLIIGSSGSRKTNALLNLIKEQSDIDKIHLYAKDLSEPKYEFLIKKHEDAGIKHLNDSNTFIECSNTMMITTQTKKEKF